MRSRLLPGKWWELLERRRRVPGGGGASGLRLYSSKINALKVGAWILYGTTLVIDLFGAEQLDTERMYVTKLAMYNL